MTMASRVGKARTGTVPVLERALRILDYLRDHPDGATLSDTARDLGFPKNTVFRILRTLDAHAYVRRDEASRRYGLSRRMAALTYDSARERTLMEHSLDVMRRLRDLLRETVVISILDGGEGIVLEQVQGLHPFRFVCDPGTRQLVYASASTKAILACATAAEREAALAGVQFVRQTRTTLPDRTALDRELARVRRDGYAVDRAEALDGVHCVAAPVRDHLGHPVAAITVTGPADRLPVSKFAAVGALVREHAAEISRRLGFGLNGGASAPPPAQGGGR